MSGTVLKTALLAALMSTTAIVGARADITVGFITSMSGPVSSIGIPYSRGIKAGEAHIGEVGGQKFKVIALDDASDVSNASKLARKLIEEDKVDVLIGTAGAPGSAAIMAVATEMKVPVVGITPVPGVPKNDGKPWALTVVQPASDMVGAVVQEMKAQNIKNVGFIGFSDSWGDLVYNNGKAAADKLGINIVTNERYARADTSVSAQILKVVAARPDAVLNGGSGTGGALPYTALAERGFKGPIFGTPALINPDFVRLAGAAGEGTVCSTGPVMVVNQLPDAHPSKKIGLAFKEAHLKANGVASNDGFSAYAFDAWLVLADASKRALAKAKPGTPEFRSALRDEMYQVKELAGSHGVFNFKEDSPYGTDMRALVLVKLQKGEWKFYK
ncbi:MAG TPA: ABC transporter substrate-binding protein [Beijerinckiaceae bacterium]|nr:ABC transporter substrate-binding protein [Beijerinckiaceae bacterium]